MAENTEGHGNLSGFPWPSVCVRLLCVSALALRAAARIPAVRALIAGAAADHDRAARRAGRRVLLILNRRIRGRRCDSFGRRGGSGCCRQLTVTVLVELPAVDAGMELRLGRQELRGQPAKDVVDDRLGE